MVQFYKGHTLHHVGMVHSPRTLDFNQGADYACSHTMNVWALLPKIWAQSMLRIAQATSNHVPREEHGTYPLNPTGHNVIEGKFVCPMIEGNHHGTNQSEMHQIWEFASSHNCPSQSKGQFQLFNNGNTIILFQIVMAPPHLTLSSAVWDFYFDNE